ncbi:MAG TPA: DUF1501 domain-containing protein [Isosphaeraceae bacterium]|nr:DUF1501 domain-containing protein [Isosphaeraceae bacterium]
MGREHQPPSPRRVFAGPLPSGVDTQLFAHSNLLLELSGALKAFLDDLAAARLADRVVESLLSEFGRTVRDNGSAGTGHGTSGPVFLAGPSVQGGLVGATPSLLDLDPNIRRPQDRHRFPPDLRHGPRRMAGAAGPEGVGRRFREASSVSRLTT